MNRSDGPLAGVRVVEMAGIGPAPFAAMSLADMGADVIRVDRPAAAEMSTAPPEQDVLNRGKRSIVLNLKHPDGHAALLRLIDTADVLVEGYRPGVMERLGIGPDVVLNRNPRLVFARMTGWGQDGPLASTAGHAFCDSVRVYLVRRSLPSGAASPGRRRILLVPAGAPDLSTVSRPKLGRPG